MHHSDFRGHAPCLFFSWKGSWEDHLAFAKFAYDNSYQASIKMVPYETIWETLGDWSWLVHIGFKRHLRRYKKCDKNSQLLKVDKVAMKMLEDGI